MKIVIDLDEKYYNDIKNSPTASNYSTLYALFGIRNGTLLSEELEKIKAEIENMWIKSAKDLKTGKVIYENLCEHSEVLEIIDNHIAELKGENNDL